MSSFGRFCNKQILTNIWDEILYGRFDMIKSTLSPNSYFKISLFIIFTFLKV